MLMRRGLVSEIPVRCKSIVQSHAPASNNRVHPLWWHSHQPIYYNQIHAPSEFCGENGRLYACANTKWLEEHFEPSTRKHALKDDGTLRKRLLLFDDHGSHCTFEFLDCCRWNDIIPFKLPPHTSWKLQSLDVTVFGPYKQYVLSAEKHWYERFKRRIGKEEFIEILLKERHSAMTH